MAFLAAADNFVHVCHFSLAQRVKVVLLRQNDLSPTVPENQKPSIEKVLFLKQTEAGVKEFHVIEFLNS